MPNVHTTLTSLFSAIANAIRGKTGSSAQIVADDFPDAIDAIPTGTPLPPLTDPATAADVLNGKEVIMPDANNQPVKVTGELFDAFGRALSLGGWFRHCNLNTNKIIINAPLAKSCESVFRDSVYEPNTEIVLNAPLAFNFGDAFNAADLSRVNLKKITLVYDPTARGLDFTRAFNQCRGLIEIDCDFDLTNITTKGGAMFSYCVNLETLRFVPNTIPNTLNQAFIGCYSLSDSSLISLANGLKDGVTGQTLTLPATPKARTLNIMGTVSQVTEDGVTYNFFTADEQGTTSLNAFITTIKGWTLA